MKKLSLYARVCKLFLSGKFVTKEDIGSAYNLVSKEYENKYLDTMHIYNDQMLTQALSSLNIKQHLKILDLAGGTGYNTSYLKKYLSDCKYDIVDISRGMLEQIEVSDGIACFQDDMISYLQNCNSNSYDLVVCSWALKYQNPKNIIKQCYRVLKNNGKLVVIVNTKQTLPEVRKVYSTLLANNVDKIKKLMMELPNPYNQKQFNKWFLKNGFHKQFCKSGKHTFQFSNPKTAVEFVTTTGALAGFDVMIGLHDKEIQQQMISLFEKEQIKTITHTFVYGIYVKEQLCE